jgi:hypothetical protein
MKKCTGECGEWKELSEFSPKQSKCKVCRSKESEKYRKTAFGGLDKSCQGAIARARRTNGSYALVICDFGSPAKFRDKVWENNDLREMWLKSWKRYEDSGFDFMFRPEIDRIDPAKNYTLNNIQFLSKDDHLIKDGHKSMLDLFYLDSYGKPCVRRMTKAEGEREFRELENVMDGGFGDGLLLQDASITVNPARLVKRDKEKDKRQAIEYLAGFVDTKPNGNISMDK